MLNLGILRKSADTSAFSGVAYSGESCFIDGTFIDVANGKLACS
jgi:hypothetical protein